ncbi:ankyrin repeat-containing protein NPR4-like isoform X1 [Papaver somniferum]|uniref:ankyrin repeat-containing protein NPR4-like isoform X1 n=1 Tax=Papaver somniferum TaxID=3469 RepID=UPI000E700BE3|nr:ankyrin repeat-containing protein NPR4-like isoform X1 [Papaver somniferum]XP_026457070.1 ankyrin repeat-containing protein NPR4-like isoform X1 [Papaver somniferum]XP_026457071.1 ankyrin repeat-containing protein NPR4-like isoform X1 [Papaver somniferum]XP_026457072.1 ankyrin repeat-containing protein NPR4-like isoform X1 [Papaver somniferum]XP_026457073.1 ankyrin repeat-containing protein NPR4-like isoform X1 [Papaver somniferum]XP_026457074.1 ankyrin repeat-containing protein NPR4-like i
MNYMAERPFAFASGAKHTFWQHLIYSLINVDINSAYELDNHTKERNTQRGLEGTNEDKEDLVERFEGPYRDEENPTENSENTKEGKPKPFRWETIGVRVMLLYLISLMIKFFVFTVRFIWTPVTRMKELFKQLYNDKVKHEQAKVLVKCIFTSLKERMTKPGVKDFFKGSDVMKMAIRHGSVEFVEVCLQLFPSLIWDKMGGEYILQMAIAERNETILNLICKQNEKEKIDLVSKSDDMGNTILHYAAKLAPSAQLNSIPGAYLQMQREMQWFKRVENMISKHMKFKRNKNGETAHSIFTKEHKELKESGEKWLKDTSGSCMVVAALIATVAFASAFTVPGGNISDNNSSKNGIPVFLECNSFMVFAIADALALFSSITSVLMFLAIYTSRYAEIDFLKSLPNKLIIGLATLFMSMASVLVAFGASLLIMLGERVTWVLVPIVVFSCVPVTLFAWLQLPLFFEMIRSTYWGNLFQEHTYISSLRINSKKED